MTDRPQTRSKFRQHLLLAKKSRERGCREAPISHYPFRVPDDETFINNRVAVFKRSMSCRWSKQKIAISRHPKLKQPKIPANPAKRSMILSLLYARVTSLLPRLGQDAQRNERKYLARASKDLACGIDSPPAG